MKLLRNEMLRMKSLRECKVLTDTRECGIMSTQCASTHCAGGEPPLALCHPGGGKENVQQLGMTALFVPFERTAAAE